MPAIETILSFCICGLKLTIIIIEGNCKQNTYCTTLSLAIPLFSLDEKRFFSFSETVEETTSLLFKYQTLTDYMYMINADYSIERIKAVDRSFTHSDRKPYSRYNK